MRLLKVPAAAERLDVSPATVYRLVHAGRLEPHFIGTGKSRPRVRIEESELDRFIQHSKDGAAKTHPPSGPQTPPPPPGPKQPQGCAA
jgi:excisionase family DNA binding protein